VNATPPAGPTVVVGDRLVAALEMAVRLHARQTRKGTRVPYISHLLAVAGLVLEHGGDEDQAIAALLHDGPEDQGGEATLDAIRRRFGDRVAGIVAACSDTFAVPKPPWRARKEAYIAALPRKGPDVWPVTLADKVHNARTIVADLRADGPHILDRFSGGRDGTIWYYSTLAVDLAALAPGALADELVALAVEMRALAGR
jgi:GTP pyrophosphokinase